MWGFSFFGKAKKVGQFLGDSCVLRELFFEGIVRVKLGQIPNESNVASMG